MKKVTVLLMIVCSVAINSQAQKSRETGSDYKTAVGVRVTAPFMFEASLKHFLFNAGALEVHAGFGNESRYSGIKYFRAGAMYQHHFPIGSIPGFKWYVGGGAYFQAMDYDYNPNSRYSRTGFAVHAVGGVDYKFNNIPLNVSADVMPTYLIGDDYYYNSRVYGSIAARYTFR